VFLFYTVCFLERGIVSISLLIDAHQGLKLTGASGKNANKMTKMPPKLELCGENKPQLGFFLCMYNYMQDHTSIQKALLS